MFTNVASPPSYRPRRANKKNASLRLAFFYRTLSAIAVILDYLEFNWKVPSCNQLRIALRACTPTLFLAHATIS